MTAQSFQCPSCGAPLIPRGNASTISCLHCHTSVVVPEELRQVSNAKVWSTLLFDSFTVNDHNWLVGNQGGEHFTKLNQSIVDGRYRWEAQVGKSNSIAPSWLMAYRVSDFHLIVNCKHIRGSRADSGYGVVFRIQDNHNYYWFRITDNQFFAVSVAKDGQWLNVVDWTRTDTIKPNGVNQVEVIAYETHFTFLINGQIASEVDDDHFSQGVGRISHRRV